MPWPLSCHDDNCMSMFHTLGMNNHALTVVIRRWQLTEHVSYLRKTLPCSDRCHETMATDGACHETVATDRAWFTTLGMNSYALTVVFIPWQLTEQVSYMRDILPCSDRCQETITIDGACFIHEGYNTMFWPFSWDEDNWGSLFHTWGIHYHALTVVMRRWQLTEHIHTLGMY